MAQIILGPGLSGMDGSLHQATYRFLAKLAADDTAPGLHIEPINNSADPRARTGRVDISNRAVLFKLQAASKTRPTSSSAPSSTTRPSPSRRNRG